MERGRLLALGAVLTLAGAAVCFIGVRRWHAAAPAAPEIPWQPHGFRAPTLRCDIPVPSGWTRSASPMPDHVAELFTSDSPIRGQVIVAERVEADVAAAGERVMAYWRSGLLTSEGAKVVEDVAIADGRRLTLRWGDARSGRIESVTLRRLAGKVVEIVARYSEGDAAAANAVNGLASSLTCAP